MVQPTKKEFILQQGHKASEPQISTILQKASEIQKETHRRKSISLKNILNKSV
jgi:hypothetical protein